MEPIQTLPPDEVSVVEKVLMKAWSTSLKRRQGNKRTQGSAVLYFDEVAFAKDAATAIVSHYQEKDQQIADLQSLVADLKADGIRYLEKSEALEKQVTEWKNKP